MECRGEESIRADTRQHDREGVLARASAEKRIFLPAETHNHLGAGESGRGRALRDFRPKPQHQIIVGLRRCAVNVVGADVVPGVMTVSDPVVLDGRSTGSVVRASVSKSRVEICSATARAAARAPSCRRLASESRYANIIADNEPRAAVPTSTRLMMTSMSVTPRVRAFGVAHARTRIAGKRCTWRVGSRVGSPRHGRALPDYGRSGRVLITFLCAAG